MKFIYINNTYRSFNTLLSIIIIAFNSLDIAEAQGFSSKQQRSDFEHFEQLRFTNRDSAYYYANRIASDIDSTIANVEVGMVFDFMAEYSETRLHRYTRALEYRKHSAYIYEVIGDKACLTRTNALLGRIYLRTGDYHNAFSYSTKALEEALITQDIISEREAYLVLEQVTYFYDNNVDKAMEYNLRITERYDGREQAHQAVRALNNRFNYPITYDEAIELTARAEEISMEHGFNDLLINIYLNASMQALSNEKVDVAKEYLTRAYPLISNFKEEGYYYSASGFYNLSVGNTMQAINDLKHSIEILGQEDFDAKTCTPTFFSKTYTTTRGATMRHTKHLWHLPRHIRASITAPT